MIDSKENYKFGLGVKGLRLFDRIDYVKKIENKENKLTLNLSSKRDTSLIRSVIALVNAS